MNCGSAETLQLNDEHAQKLSLD